MDGRQKAWRRPDGAKPVLSHPDCDRRPRNCTESADPSGTLSPRALAGLRTLWPLTAGGEFRPALRTFAAPSWGDDQDLGHVAAAINSPNGWLACGIRKAEYLPAHRPSSGPVPGWRPVEGGWAHSRAVAVGHYFPSPQIRHPSGQARGQAPGRRAAAISGTHAKATPCTARRKRRNRLGPRGLAGGEPADDGSWEGASVLGVGGALEAVPLQPPRFAQEQRRRAHRRRPERHRRKAPHLSADW